MAHIFSLAQAQGAALWDSLSPNKGKKNSLLKFLFDPNHFSQSFPSCAAQHLELLLPFSPAWKSFARLILAQLLAAQGRFRP